MARDDLFRRSFEAGTAFLDMTRERAEALVKELVKAGEVRKGKAQKAIDDVLERSRKSADDLRQLIRREIADQVGALGLATKEDIARLEARLESAAAAAVPPPSPAPTKAPPVKRAGAVKAAKPAATATTPKAPKAAGKRAAPPPTPPPTPPAAAQLPVQGDGDAGGPPPNG